MSVSHPLAADDGHANAELDASAPDPRSGLAARDESPQVATPNTSSRSVLQEQVVVAPESLDLESRKKFREAASSLVDRVKTGTGRLVIDCSQVKSIDSTGLNALVIVQRKGAQRRIQVTLRDMNAELIALLVLTKLDDLFDLQDGKGRRGEHTSLP